SLAHWALQISDELSLDQEAIIRKYQNEDIRTETPVDSSKRYVPNPEDLLDHVVKYRLEENGFWLNLNGVIEFFSTDFTPIFNSKDKNEIKNYFLQETTNIQNTITSLKKEINEKNILKNVFENIENPDEYLKAWNTQTDLEEQLENHEMFKVNQVDFLEYSNLYTQSSIEEDLKNSKATYSVLNTYKSNLTTLKDNLERESENFLDPRINQEI